LESLPSRDKSEARFSYLDLTWDLLAPKSSSNSLK